jgi:hypothetical protein
MIKEELITALSQRFLFVFEDAKTYIYVRKEGIQDKEGLGGGNFTVAYSLFALLNLASKVHYYLHKPKKFTDDELQNRVKNLKDKILAIELTAEEKKLIKNHMIVPRIMETNELNAFVEFARELEADGLKLREEHDSSHDDYSTIWTGFRNMLAHLATVQNGKGVMAYTLEKHWPNEIIKSTPLDNVLKIIKEDSSKFPPFFYVSSRHGWIMNVDALLALIPDIENITIKCINESELTDHELEKLLEFIQPS